MGDWLSWFVSLVSVSVDWLGSAEFLGISLLSFLVSLVLMGVVLRAVLYKA